MKDRDTLFHEKWLGLAQPIEGLVFSVPVLADAQIAPDVRPELSASFAAHVVEPGEGAAAALPRIRELEAFVRDFLGYAERGRVLERAELPPELSFYAAEGGQEIRPSFAIVRGAIAGPASDNPDDAFDDLDGAAPAPALPAVPAAATAPMASRFSALLWDLTETGQPLDFDAAEAVTGPWRYPPTAKFERLLRHVGVAVGWLFNGESLRLVYAPASETTGHLTFRVEHLHTTEGRPLLAALDLLLHARRAKTASPEHTVEGLLAESRRRQADVTDALAKQVFEAVEVLVAGFAAAASRDAGPASAALGEGSRLDWLRPALEQPGDHFYQGVLSVVLRLVFLLYAEDQGLLPVDHPTYAEHMSLFGLHQRLAHDAGAHPESMHHRFGAYGQLLALFRGVYRGVKHGSFELPPRRGRLFDPNAFPFLEGGQPDWTAALDDVEARAATNPPSLDDGAVHRVLHRLVVFEGQRLSYRTLDVEQIGSVYESLMGYHVLRVESAALRLGKLGVWVEIAALRAMKAADRAKYLKETCGLNPGPIKSIEAALKEHGTNDEALLDAIEAHATGRIREVARHRAKAGTLVLQPGEERRRTGSHYTPRSLTEKVVKRTLEPLLACLGAERTPEQILQLKICDPAMGSGAFLVATCRELASEIVAAWTRQGELARVVEAHGNAHLYARRLVAQRCLYGVDKNPAAVELAKLSLWLVTMSKTLPFTFVDHALRHGDSLVGLDFKQIEAFHWAPPGQVEMCALVLREAMDQAVEQREQLLALADDDSLEAQVEKRRLFEFSQQSIARVRRIADVCVGAFFAEAKDAARERERKRRLGLVERWIQSDFVDHDGELEELAGEIRAKVSPFHWWIEFPEVFFQERPDPLQGGAKNGAALMEGVVGNPPFGGKNTISEASGAAMLDWLMALHPDVKGRPNTDLSAYFFRRASQLIGTHGSLGLIATNTIAQGDSRLMSLRYLVDRGAAIYDATCPMSWPGTAAVTVAIVNMAFGHAKPFVSQLRTNGQVVAMIDSRLTNKAERAEVVSLGSNTGVAFMGGKLVGAGLSMSIEERDQLVAQASHNAEVLRPYLGGEEVNNTVGSVFTRYMIDFSTKSLDEARDWPMLLRIAEEKVRPAREQDKRGTYKTYWWRPGESGGAMYQALRGRTRCLVSANVTKHLMFTMQPTHQFFSQTLYVFAMDAVTSFAILQSRVHEPWARLLSSSLEDRLRYTASDCFETFPFPQPDPRAVLPSLEAAGQLLYETRAAFMVATNQGLTKTYNALKNPACDDPRVLELRRLHEAMDRAVLDAYGWADVAVPPYCPITEADRAALSSFEDEVIDRLYVLNAERAREEALQGKAAPRGGKRAAARDGDEADDGDAAEGDEQGELFS